MGFRGLGFSGLGLGAQGLGFSFRCRGPSGFRLESTFQGAMFSKEGFSYPNRKVGPCHSHTMMDTGCLLHRLG